MAHRSKFVVAAVLACVAGGWAIAHEQQPTDHKPAAPAKPDMPAKDAGGHDPMMDEWMKSLQPGEHHKHLKAHVGTWDAKTEFFMPGQPPSTGKGTAVITEEMGGKYFRTKFKGEFEMGPGMTMPFEGEGIAGYNNMAKQYEQSWWDNMGTGVMLMTGQCDAAGKVISMAGQTDDMFNPGKKCTMREVTTMVDANTMKAEFYMPGPDGKEFKNMVITYTRKSDKPAAAPGK
jgi:hypothetical protein